MKTSKLNLVKIVFITVILISAIFVLIPEYCKYHPAKPNIILITIDALRADHLGCYGYKRNTSPNIDLLAKEGVVFLNCFATSSATINASPAMVTGRYLDVSFSVNSFRNSLTHNNILDKKFTTLAEYLKNFGYSTAGFVNNVLYRKGKGFEQGFDYFCSYWERGGSAEEMTTSVLNFLNHYQGRKPLFIWIHYLDAHAPYPPIARVDSYSILEGYLKAFENDSLYKDNDKILKIRKVGDLARDAREEGYLPQTVFREGRYNYNYYVARYDAAISYIDFQIGRLFNNIKDNAMFILTADHGESLGEHNLYFDHGKNIYDELLHVPLIIKDNKYFKGGNRVSKVVSSVDIVPTVLSRISPIRHLLHENMFDGLDLKRMLDGNSIKRKYTYSFYADAESIRDVDKNIKYILHHNASEELYFLPEEYANHINDDYPEANRIKEELRVSLKNWLNNYPIHADINAKKMPLDKDSEDILRKLGYLQ